jgi:peptidoglycan L-alanyl-D-glutamate endopeptidase CwlK
MFIKTWPGRQPEHFRQHTLDWALPPDSVEVSVFLLALTAYFLLACLTSWLILFPTGRDFVVQALAGAARHLHTRVACLARYHSARAATIARRLGLCLRKIMLFSRRHYLLSTGAAACMLVPPGLAFFSGADMALGDYAISTRLANEQVVALMAGEQLVPPPALPPAVFSTPEVARQRPMLAGASRKWDELDPVFTQVLLNIFRVMKEQHGYDMAILEGYRSPARQNQLAAMGGSVTNAAAFQSWHQYGLAADCAFLRDGRIVISERDPWAMRGYQLLGTVAESFGMTWGGRWKMMDFGHMELRRAGVMTGRS